MILVVSVWLDGSRTSKKGDASDTCSGQEHDANDTRLLKKTDGSDTPLMSIHDSRTFPRLPLLLWQSVA